MSRLRGSELRIVRRKCGRMTQADLAEFLGVSLSSVQKWEVKDSVIPEKYIGDLEDLAQDHDSTLAGILRRTDLLALGAVGLGAALAGPAGATVAGLLSAVARLVRESSKEVDSTPRFTPKRKKKRKQNK